MGKEYDFFEEENKEEGKDVQRIPAPYVASGKQGEIPPKRTGKFGWQYIVTAIALAVVFFFAGGLVCWVSLDEEIRTLLTVKEKIQDDYYKEITDEEFYAAVFGGINDGLLDEYSCYMTPAEFAEYTKDMQGSRIGIGLVFTSGGSDPLRITRVCGNSPAEAAGFLAGERILSCGDGADSLTACTTFQQFSDLIAVYGENEKFYIEVSSADGQKRVVEIYKSEYTENLVFYRTKDSAYAFTGDNAETLTEKGAPMPYLDGDTAYIRLISFTGNAAKEFEGAMEKFRAEGKKHLVLDLRENGGGYLDTMQSIAGYFCKTATAQKPVVAVADYGDKKVEYTAYGNKYDEYFSEESRIYLLADGGSASASECLIGCMLDYGAISYADICLTERDGAAKTFGKGIMQETKPVHLFKQDALKLTTAEIRWPKGNSIHGRGVLSSDGTKSVPAGASFEEETENAVKKLLSLG